MDTIDENTPAARYRRERKRLSENHFNRAHTIGGWLLATLAATNLTAMGAVLAFAKGGPAAEKHPAIAFAIGVVTAILAGFVLSGEASARSSLYYYESVEPDELSLVDVGRHDRRKRWAPRLSAFGRVLNGLSLAAFVWGACWTLML